MPSKIEICLSRKLSLVHIGIFRNRNKHTWFNYITTLFTVRLAGSKSSSHFNFSSNQITSSFDWFVVLSASFGTDYRVKNLVLVIDTLTLQP